MLHRARLVFAALLDVRLHLRGHQGHPAPSAQRKAFEAGLKKMVLRVDRWGPRGERRFSTSNRRWRWQSSTNRSTTPGSSRCWGLRQTIPDRRRVLQPGRLFRRPGCFDTGFNGLTLYFATWLAVRNDWPWAKESVAQAWKLRGYLMLPEPGTTKDGQAAPAEPDAHDVAHEQPGRLRSVELAL